MGKPVLLLEPCYSLGNKTIDVGCTKSKDRHTAGRSCLFLSSVFATICPLKNPPNPPNSRHFDDVVLNLRIHSFNFFFFYTSFFLDSSPLSVYLLAPDADNFLSKALVFPCVSSYR